jgi:hypothetical protein
MTIRQLQRVFNVKDDQRVRVNDGRKLITIESDYGWCFEPDYEYEGFNYDEIERIMKLSVDGAEFNGKVLTIWAH